MIAQASVSVPTREAALMRMRTALDEMYISGIKTNLDFQYQILRHPVFCEGKADTGFIDNYMMPGAKKH